MNRDGLFSKIQEDMKNALRAHNQERLGALRLLIAAIRQREIDERTTLDDGQIFAVISKMQKQLKDSITQFQSAERQDLVAKETVQLEIIQEYLPKPLTTAEINNFVKDAIMSTQATSIKDLGKVINELKQKLQGKVDFGEVSSIAKNLLSTESSS